MGSKNPRRLTARFFNLTLPLRFLAVVEDPDIGGDAGIEEE